MSEQIEIIEAEHKRLSETSTKLSDYLAKIIADISKLRAERKKVIEQMKEISGAVQAYSQTLGLFKSATQPAAPTTVEGKAEVVSEDEAVAA